MSAFDASVTQWINGLAGYSLVADYLMIWVTKNGVPLMVLAVAAQWWIKTDRNATRHTLVAAGLSFLLGLAINQVILLFVMRARPYDAGLTQLLIDRSADPSFPSDHATAAFAIAATFLFAGLLRRGYAFLVAATLIALSRVYVGTHYLSDVAGGAAIGVAAAAIVHFAYRPGTRLDRLVTSIL